VAVRGDGFRQNEKGEEKEGIYSHQKGEGTLKVDVEVLKMNRCHRGGQEQVVQTIKAVSKGPEIRRKPLSR